MQQTYDTVRQLLEAGKTAEAERLVLQELEVVPNDATLLYLKGRIGAKRADWQGALNAFNRAVQLDPDSPAREARQAIEEILAFYHKDYYNPQGGRTPYIYVVRS